MALAEPVALFRFYGDLNDHLPPARRQGAFPHPIGPGGSVKDAIEAIGVPHPEVALVLVDGTSVAFDHGVRPGQRIAVYPRFRALDVTSLSRVAPPPLAETRFVLDVHLGRLARWLRLLGFDTSYRNDAGDGELARLAHREGRLLLTRDRGLLKRALVVHGYRVRATDPEDQVVEVLQRLGLEGAVAPFRRCPRCNGRLEPVAKRAIAHRLPLHTREATHSFRRCRDCGRLYWRGAHHRRLEAFLARVGARLGGRSSLVTSLTVAVHPPAPLAGEDGVVARGA